MLVYRIVKEKYANGLFASGRAARWNEDKQWVIYTSESRSLATFELLVHKASVNPQSDFKILVIFIDEQKNALKEVAMGDLPENWRKFEAYPKLREIANYWYQDKQSLILKVPSIVIPKEFNYIINTKHNDFKENVYLKAKEDYFWDNRL
jgi:RES domain-containing protein